jgi:peptide-methionine (S)-S-oxide reductase
VRLRPGAAAVLFEDHIRLTQIKRSGRSESIPVPAQHFVKFNPLTPPWPDGMETAVFGLGCFWGAERKFWEAKGVYSTAVGYAGGYTPNPTYEEVCSGRTGHAEVVLVVFDPEAISYESLLKIFWESHDPTQGNAPGQRRRHSTARRSTEHARAAEAAGGREPTGAARQGYGKITTEIADEGPFYYAESYHQQYLAKNPNGYCGIGGTGVSCPVGLTAG